jgi:hypothetical protein
MIPVKRYRSLELHSRFGQLVLNPAEHSEGVMRARPVCIAFERFQKQLLGKRLVFSLRAAPPLRHFPD